MSEHLKLNRREKIDRAQRLAALLEEAAEVCLELRTATAHTSHYSRFNGTYHAIQQRAHLIRGYVRGMKENRSYFR